MIVSACSEGKKPTLKKPNPVSEVLTLKIKKKIHKKSILLPL
jgi:hypothetical protein